MSANLLVSLIGLGFSINGAAATPAFVPQVLEGQKVCETGMLKVLYREKEKRLLMKYNDTVYVMTEKRALVKNVRRFENNTGTLVYLHLPEKAMLLDQKAMKPIYTECRGV